jgi:hypothetical protein
MSKKLLNETQIRRFMKLANLSNLTEGGYGGMGPMGDRDEDEGADPVGGDPMADMADDPDMSPPEGMDDEADGEVVLSSEDAQKVAEALPAMEKIAAAVGGDDDMGGMDDMAPDDDDMGGDPEAPAPDMGGEDDMMEALSAEGVELLDENEIVDAVIQRVANRLVNESRRQKRDKKLETLADRIVSKIAGSR